MKISFSLFSGLLFGLFSTLAISADNQLSASSKFATWPGFAANKNGHIGLQDHGDKVWFKNIKIRELN